VSLDLDRHDVELAHQPQAELAKHAPQVGKVLHSEADARLTANAASASRNESSIPRTN